MSILQGGGDLQDVGLIGFRVIGSGLMEGMRS